MSSITTIHHGEVSAQSAFQRVPAPLQQEAVQAFQHALREGGFRDEAIRHLTSGLQQTLAPRPPESFSAAESLARIGRKLYEFKQDTFISMGRNGLGGTISPTAASIETFEHALAAALDHMTQNAVRRVAAQDEPRR